MFEARNDFGAELIALMPSVRRFARTFLKGAEGADDLVQDTLMRAWQARDSFEPGTDLEGWLFKILVNRFSDVRRREWRHAPWDADAAEKMPIPERDVPLFVLQLQETILLLGALSDEHCAALVLVRYLEKTYGDAAFEMNCAEGTVKSRVARATHALQKLEEDTSLKPSFSSIAWWEHASAGYVSGRPGYELRLGLESLHAIAHLGEPIFPALPP